MKKNNWKRGPTADSLGMDRRTLFRKMKDFGLERITPARCNPRPDPSASPVKGGAFPFRPQKNVAFLSHFSCPLGD
ncbi:MAG: helix-turn-helix domain-containing protein [Bilophila wadsworthia]